MSIDRKSEECSRIDVLVVEPSTSVVLIEPSSGQHVAKLGKLTNRVKVGVLSHGHPC